MRARIAPIGIVLALLCAGCLGAPTEGERDELEDWTEALFAPPPPGNLTERLTTLHERLANVSLAPYATSTNAFKANNTYPTTVANAGRDIDALLEREAVNSLLEAAVIAATIRQEHANLTCAGRHPITDVEAQGLALVRDLEGTEQATSPRLAEAELMLASRLDSAKAFLGRDDCRSVYQRRAILLAVDLLGASRDDTFPRLRPAISTDPDIENWTIPEELPVHASQDLVQATRAAPYCMAQKLRPCVLYAAIVKARTDALAEAYANTTGDEDLFQEVAELDPVAWRTPPGEAARSIVADGRTATAALRLALAQVAAARLEANLLAACSSGSAEKCITSS